MPPRKKNSKSRRRGTTAARKAQPQARRDGGQAASAAPPSSRVPPDVTGPPAENPPSGGASGSTVPPGLRPAGNSRPGPAAASARPGVVPETGEHARLTPAIGGRVGVVPPGQVAPAGPKVTVPSPKPAATPVDAAPGTAPGGASDDLPQWAAKAVEELLTVTHWLDPGTAGEPFSATIRFSGQRAGVTGKPQDGDAFSRDVTVEGIVPGSGPVAITAEVRGINQGEWKVTPRPVGPVGSRPYKSYPPATEKVTAPRVPWPRHVAMSTDADVTVHTARLLRTRVPGIVRFAYASLVSLGVLVGLSLEALLLARGHYSLLRPMLYSVLAIVAGVIGGKAWYVAVHKGRKFDGWCIQGFVAGAVVVVAAAALAGSGVPAGAYLAAAAPALLIGMAIGRLGCFWAGCCTGRPIAARWGIWSSDRQLGCRRAPAQLLEALAALISGVTVLVVVLVAGLPRSGPVAIVGLAVYTLCRQFILGLRAEPRVWRYGRRVTAAAAAIALILGVILLARG
jgi:phosphatidylglycerol:prolipoprotein diacylglycerol transferase